MGNLQSGGTPSPLAAEAQAMRNAAVASAQAPPSEKPHSKRLAEPSPSRAATLDITSRSVHEAELAGSEWALNEEQRKRRLEDFFDVPAAEIGRGHYGVVRKGKRISDGLPVAIKTIPKRRQAYIDMIRNEIDVLDQIEDEHVIRLLDAFEDRAQIYLVFELCYGGELFDSIADPGFSFTEPQAARLMKQLLLAVKALHAADIVHRDLKPENVLLATPGVDSEVRVIDFGLATRIRPGELLKRHMGTPYYIAPEVLEKRYGKACDMWSLGVMLFTLMCGYPPFFGDMEKDIYARIRRGVAVMEGTKWVNRSPAVKDLIRKLLVSMPSRRLSPDAAMAHRWIVFEGDVPQPGSPTLIVSLRTFACLPWLKRLMLAVACRSLHQEHAALLKQVFEAFANADGVVRAVELRATLSGWGVKLSPLEAQTLMQALDLNHDGALSFTEIAAPLVPRMYYLDAARLLDAFSVFDVDRDGFISLSDLEHMVGDSAMATAVLDEADLDGDGRLSFADFVGTVAPAGERS